MWNTQLNVSLPSHRDHTTSGWSRPFYLSWSGNTLNWNSRITWKRDEYPQHTVILFHRRDNENSTPYGTWSEITICHICCKTGKLFIYLFIHPLPWDFFHLNLYHLVFTNSASPLPSLPSTPPLLIPLWPSTPPSYYIITQVLTISDISQLKTGRCVLHRMKIENWSHFSTPYSTAKTSTLPDKTH